MEKPFDLKDLGSKLLSKLKAQAVPMAEAVLDWTSESCALSSGAIVKGIGAVIVVSKPAILAEVEKAVK